MPQPKYDQILGAHRTFNKWADSVVAWGSHNVDYQMASIEDYLDQPRFAGLKYRYYNSDAYKELQKDYLAIPYKEILKYAETLMRPVYTDFTEVTENKEFMKISADFYRELFIQEYIFVSYKVFNDKNTVVIVEQNNDENAHIIEQIKAEDGFDLWVKLDENKYSKNVEFMHIPTSLVVKFPK